MLSVLVDLASMSLSGYLTVSDCWQKQHMSSHQFVALHYVRSKCFACRAMQTKTCFLANTSTRSALEQVFISNECGIELTVGPGALASSAFWTLRGASAYVAGRLGTTLTHIFQQHSMYNMVKVCYTWRIQHSHSGCRGMQHTPLQSPAEARN